MKTRKWKLRYFFLIVGLFIGAVPAFSHTLLKPLAQGENFANQKSIDERYRFREGFESYQHIEVNLNALTEVNNIEAFFFGSKIVVNETNKYVRNIKNYSWFGYSADFRSSIMISVLDTDIQGVITNGDELYKIETFDNEYILIKINQPELNKKDCGSINQLNEDEFSSVHKQTTDLNLKRAIEGFKCKIRVLVMYTPSVSSLVSNVQNLAQLSVDQMNQTFINSQINAEVELVHVQLTNYIETNIIATSSATHDNDLTRFTKNGDGYMDEVHSLREEFSADICVLISDIPESLGYAGIARSIKSSAQNSFCIVDYWYSYLNLTFAHEIGHLFGCRHDQGSDPNNAPYAYGHGYTFINPSLGSWRTIMATTNSCGGCPRNPYWSNPNVFIFNNATGTVSINNNARVINENIANVLSHRPSNSSLVVNQTKVNSAISGSLYNSNTITTSGSVVIDHLQEFEINAGYRVMLMPGFRKETGSNFVARIVPTCGLSDGLRGDYGLSNDSISYALKSTVQTNDKNCFSEMGEVKVSEVEIYPNPTVRELIIRFNLIESNNQVNINIVNFNGHLVSKVLNENCDEGIHSLNFDMTSFAPGVYFILFSINEIDVVSHKIVKN